MNTSRVSTGTNLSRGYTTTATKTYNLNVTEPQLKYLAFLKSKYAITIDMKPITTKKLASKKIDDIKKAIDEGRVKERTTKIFVKSSDLYVNIDTSYDAQKDFDNQPKQTTRKKYNVKRVIMGQISIEDYMGSLPEPKRPTVDLGTFNDSDILILGSDDNNPCIGCTFDCTSCKHSYDDQPRTFDKTDDIFDPNNYSCAMDFYRATSNKIRPGEDLTEFNRELLEGLMNLGKK